MMQKEKTEEAEDIEKIKLAMSEAQMGEDGYQELTTDNLGYELIKDGTKAIVSDNEDGTKHILFLDEKKEYSLDNNGNIEDLNIDFDTKYAAPASQDEERNNGVIGIGTDGQPVDMDLWKYTLLDDNTYILNDSEESKDKGYIGSYDNEGKIIGVVPMYISKDNGKTYTVVTSMKDTFFYCESLKIAPKIPYTINNLYETFQKCSNLREMPQITNNVINMIGTFYDCTSLVQIYDIPNSVTDLSYCFSGCSSLKDINISLGNNVTKMIATFARCSNLKSVPKLPDKLIDMERTFENTAIEYSPTIPNEVTNLKRTFRNCSNLKEAPNIPSKVQCMRWTFQNCTSLETPPSLIPNSVNNMQWTFDGCIKLKGSIKIDANLTGKIIEDEEESGW